MEKRKYGFWAKLDPLEGMIMVVVIILGLFGVAFVISSLTLISWKDFIGRLAIGTAVIAFAGGYIYQTAKTKRRKNGF